MSTANKIPTPNALILETVVKNLNLALNEKRSSILDQYNVSEMEADIIRYLYEHEMQKMKEVGEHFNIKLSTLTSTVDKLEKNKLVKRRNSKEDRRVIYIQPTAKGQRLLDDLISSTRHMSEAVKAKTQPGEFATLVRGLENMLAAVAEK